MLSTHLLLNRYWEANLKDRKPTESNMEMWIRAKYEQKRWAMKGPIPDPSTLGGEDDEVTQVDRAYIKLMLHLFIHVKIGFLFSFFSTSITCSSKAANREAQT